jgi:raffinose/stachyose/melibiose transport system permease protein
MKMDSAALGRLRRAGLIAFEAFMICVAIVFIYPTVFVLINAFKPSTEIVINPLWPSVHPTMENFKRVIGTEGAGGVTFLQSMWNTVFLCVASVLGILLISSMAAWKLVRSGGKISNVLYFFFAFFIVIPFQIIMVPLVVLATDLRFKDHLGLILMYWGLGAPSAVFMFHGFVKGIPLALEESAAIDGAGPYRTFFTIVLPMMGPIITTISILNTLWVWNDFLLPYIILRKGTLVLFQFNFFGTFTQDYGALTASLVMTATPVVILYVFMQKYIVKGITAGAVKG